MKGFLNLNPSPRVTSMAIIIQKNAELLWKDNEPENADKKHDDVQINDHKVSEPAQNQREIEESKEKSVKVPKSKYTTEMKKEV